MPFPAPPPPVWDLPGPAAAPSPELVHDLGLPPVVARLLDRRGLGSIDLARAFLDPTLDQLKNPESMAGMAEAMDLLSRVLDWTGPPPRGFGVWRLGPGLTLCAPGPETKPTVGVYTDYDVDGITAGACLANFLNYFDIPVAIFQPRRLDQGYGLKPEGLDILHRLGAQVVITADCGVQDHEAVAYGRSLGLRLIVTDHHRPGPRLPPADAVINPHRPDCPFHGEPLAGVGVAFCLIVALRSRLRDMGVFARRPEPNLVPYLDLVALGTLADAVPLIGQNRVLAAVGLRVAEDTTRPGLQALKEVSAVGRRLTTFDVTFRLGPRLNAPGRLDDAAPALELMLCPDLTTSRQLARELDELNRRRLDVQQQLMDEVRLRLAGPEAGDGAIVLHGPHWHRGVLGIVAARMVRDFGRPTILLAGDRDPARGSGRAPEEINLFDALSQCADLLVSFGGHRAAAGLALDRDGLDDFRAKFSQLVRDQAPNGLRPRLRVEAELGPADLDPYLLDHLARLAPFGTANPEPVFLIRDAAPRDPRLIKDRHLKLGLKVGDRFVDAIGFDQAAKLDRLADRIDLVGRLRLDAFTGDMAFHLLDLRPATP